MNTTATATLETRQSRRQAATLNRPANPAARRANTYTARHRQKQPAIGAFLTLTDRIIYNRQEPNTKPPTPLEAYRQTIEALIDSLQTKKPREAVQAIDLITENLEEIKPLTFPFPLHPSPTARSRAILTGSERTEQILEALEVIREAPASERQQLTGLLETAALVVSDFHAGRIKFQAATLFLSQQAEKATDYRTLSAAFPN